MDEIEALRKLGFTEYQTKIYLKLLELGPSKATEITKASGVPKNKVYELLDKLINEGFIELIPTTPKRYFIKKIDSLMVLIKKRKDELKQLGKKVLELKSKRNKPLSNTQELVWIINGHNAFVEKVKESMRLTRKENLILARKIRADPMLIRLTEQAIIKGAVVKMLLPEKSDRLKIKEWQDIGVKIRYLTSFPEITFSTFDDKICRINLNVKDIINDPTLWIESKPFIQILRERFQTLWKTAKS